MPQSLQQPASSNSIPRSNSEDCIHSIHGGGIGVGFGNAGRSSNTATRMGMLTVIILLMAVGALFASRRTWLVISLVTIWPCGFLQVRPDSSSRSERHLRLAPFFRQKIADPSTLMPFGAAYMLPVGISFFTFQSLSYTHRFLSRQVHRERSFLRFATFVCFFRN